MEEEQQSQFEPPAEAPLESLPEAAQRETFGSDGEALAHHEG
jgi:hypothetical protein